MAILERMEQMEQRLGIKSQGRTDVRHHTYFIQEMRTACLSHRSHTSVL